MIRFVSNVSYKAEVVLISLPLYVWQNMKVDLYLYRRQVSIYLYFEFFRLAACDNYYLRIPGQYATHCYN